MLLNLPNNFYKGALDIKVFELIELPWNCNCKGVLIKNSIKYLLRHFLFQLNTNFDTMISKFYLSHTQTLITYLSKLSVSDVIMDWKHKQLNCNQNHEA